ncbi:Superinfection immunity protein [Pseudomonas linyingensis]|uniref:Superinfection immunity protein n=1 Tax=Pseudomonas linyingensis TaxID=915471 RepID=A0A1H6YA21_9PSED|nr:superinfection immunity protein [Pseudomonas linyingensis]SEJ33990.1 Superinfection immunity protein [Pseudomonas linyingensis]
MFAVRLIVLLLLTAYSYGMGTEPGELNAFGKTVAGSFFLLAPALYFLPSYEAWRQDHVNLTPIVLINTFLGWTLIGWVVSLVWSQKRSEPVEVAVVTPQRQTKTCPYCAEEILLAAKKCKHCGSEVAAA